MTQTSPVVRRMRLLAYGLQEDSDVASLDEATTVEQVRVELLSVIERARRAGFNGPYGLRLGDLIPRALAEQAIAELEALGISVTLKDV